jgi:hypothetical protein
VIVYTRNQLPPCGARRLQTEKRGRVLYREGKLKGRQRTDDRLGRETDDW